MVARFMDPVPVEEEFWAQTYMSVVSGDFMGEKLIHFVLTRNFEGQCSY
jgi:hypothetical protein